MPLLTAHSSGGTYVRLSGTTINGLSEDLDDRASDLVEVLDTTPEPSTEASPTTWEDLIPRETLDNAIKYKYRYVTDSGIQWLDEKRIEKDDSPPEAPRRLDEILTVRQAKKQVDGEMCWSTDSFDVHSDSIVDLINAVVQDYPGMPKVASDYEAPFEPFFHRFKAIESYVTNTKDLSGKAIRDLAVFCAFLAAELAPAFAARETVRTKSQATFSRLWTSFYPGQLVVYWANGGQQIMQLTHTQYKSSSYLLSDMDRLFLKGRQINWNGDFTGYEDVYTSVLQFEGVRTFDELSVAPLESYNENERLKIRQSLIARGYKFAKLRGSSVKFYKGAAFGGLSSYGSFNKRVQGSKR